VPRRALATIAALAASAFALPPAAGAPLPPPQLARTADVTVQRGAPRVRLAGARDFVPLAGAQQVPFGTEIDARGRGRVRIETARAGGAATQSGVFGGGRFLLIQAPSGLTVLRLSEPLSCPRAKAYPAARGPRTRALRGDADGAFRIRGSFGAATATRAAWLVRDRCRSTLTRVRSGRVTVRDSIRKRDVPLRAGDGYLVRSRR
jgi:hypothetical protein